MSVPPGLEFLDAGAWYAQHVAPQRARLTRQREVVQQLQALQAQVRGIATTRTAQAQRGVDQALMRALQGSTLQRIAESLLQRAWRRWWMTPIALLPLLLLLTQTLPPERLPAWSPLALALVGLALWTARPTWVGLSARLLRGPQLAGGVLLLLALALATQLPSAHWGGLSLGLVPAWVAAVCAAGAVRAWRRQQQLRPGPLRWTLEGGRGLELTLRALDGRVVPVVRLTRTELDAVGPLGDPVAQALTAWLRSRAGADVFQRLQQLTALSTPASELETLERLDQQIRTHLQRVDDAQARLTRTTDTLAGLWLPRPVLEGLMGGLALFRDQKPGAPTGTLLVGPPGTGKTEAARRLAQAAGVPVRVVDATQLKAGHIGGTEAKVRELWEDVQATAPCILIVDECDAVFADRSRPDTDTFARSLTEGFLAAWQPTQPNAPRVWVIGATNYRDRLDPAILSRLGQVLEVPLPDAAARRGLLTTQLLAQDLPLTLASPIVIDRLQGFSGRDIATFAQTLALQYHAGVGAADPVALADTWRRRQGLAAAREGADPAAAWARIVLPPPVRQRLWTLTHALREAEALRARGFELPLGVLLAGPPGTGKTETARTLASAAGVGFVAGNLATLKGSYLGHSSAQTKQLFARARAAAPAILFLDELEAMMPARGTGDQYTDEIVAQVLVELDGITASPAPLLLVGATNHPERVDPAVRSRLGEVLELPLPDAPTRAAILTVLLQEAGGGDRPDLLHAVESLTAPLTGWSGRDLRTAVRDAQQLALSRALGAGDVRTARLELADLQATLTAR